jgi:hypothetical protein
MHDHPERLALALARRLLVGGAGKLESREEAEAESMVVGHTACDAKSVPPSKTLSEAVHAHRSSSPVGAGLA